MSTKKFSTVVKQRIVLGIVGLIFIVLGAWAKGCFYQKEEKPPTTTNTDKDSSTLINVQTEHTTIGRDQNNAGRDITIKNESNADSSK